MAELRPCPFCGCETVGPYAIRDGLDVACAGCGASVRAHHPNALEKATKLWNTRSPVEDARGELVEALKEIASGEAFREMRFAEDDDADYFLRAQRSVQKRASAALAKYLPSQPESPE